MARVNGLKHLNYVYTLPYRFNGFNIERKEVLVCDEAGFDKAMKEQKSRSLPQVSTDDWKILGREYRNIRWIRPSRERK
jgi:hypothetical protein